MPLLTAFCLAGGGYVAAAVDTAVFVVVQLVVFDTAEREHFLLLLRCTRSLRRKRPAVVEAVELSSSAEVSTALYVNQLFWSLVREFGTDVLVDVAVRKPTPLATQKVKVKNGGGN